MPEDNELSEREREILRLVATGASNKEIALKLVISPNTVKVHLRNIFAKVGVASRTEATLYAIRSGLLPAPVVAASAASAVVEETGDRSQVAATVSAESEPAENLTGETPAQLPRRRWILYAALALALLGLAASAGGLLQRAVAPQPGPVASTVVALSERWSILPALPDAAQDLAGAVYAEQIYVTGGENAGAVSGRTWRFDAAAKKWTACADKPTPISQASAALLSEKIYVPGGKGADGQPSRVVEVYDPRTDQWEQAAALPEARSAYALAALEGRLYLFGGWDGQKVVSSVYAYDPQQDRWETRAQMPAARAFAGAAATGGKIVVLGGWDGQTALEQVEAYYPSRDRPGETAWEQLQSLPQPRYAAGTAAIAEVVYVVGGEGQAEGNDLAPLQLAPQDGQWSSFAQPPAPAGSHLLLLALDTHLHAVAGARHQAYQAIYNLAFPVIQ